MPKASVIIVNLNGRDFLAELLPGLLEQDTAGMDLDVLIVDNGSRDGSVEFIEMEFPQIRVLRLDMNHGFAPAVNKGVEQTDGDYIILLNNDCRVRKNWLAELIHPFKANENIACVGSLILDTSGKSIDFHYGTANIFGWGFQQGRGDASSTARTEPFRTFFACGAACAFRRDVYTEAGGLLNETFAYFEDVEIGWRLNALGHEVWMNPASMVEHHHGATVSRFGKGFHAFLTERNALLNAWCNLSPEEGAVIVPVAMSLSSLRFAARSGLTPEDPLGEEGLRSILHARGDEPIKRGTVDGMKDMLKKRGSAIGIDGGAPLEAVADFGRLIPKVQARRDRLAKQRKVRTSDLLEFLGEPFRPVIGHPREKAFIEEIKPYIMEIIG